MLSARVYNNNITTILNKQKNFKPNVHIKNYFALLLLFSNCLCNSNIRFRL